MTRRTARLLRHGAFALLLALGLAAAGQATGTPESARQHWDPATPEEALIHQLDQAADLDRAGGLRR